MTDIFKKALVLIAGDSSQIKLAFKPHSERDLIRLESEIGRELFGPIPAGHSREFFCLDDKTWIWYEEWTDEAKKRQIQITRYELHSNGILKVQEGQPYRFVSGQELSNLAIAARSYYQLVMQGIYESDPATGEKLAPAPEQMPSLEEPA